MERKRLGSLKCLASEILILIFCNRIYQYQNTNIILLRGSMYIRYYRVSTIQQCPYSVAVLIIKRET